MESSAAVIALVVLLGACANAVAQDAAPPAPGDDSMPTEDPTPKGESRFALTIGDEASRFAGARSGSPSAANLLWVQPSFAYRHGDRWRVSASGAALLDSRGTTQARLRVRETYASVSAGDWDFALGRKILRWGTGYAFTPTGFLDPPRRATDPTDRFGLDEGREVVAASWVRGRHSLTAAWASAGLLERRADLRETAALRYNALLAGFDTSLVYARERGGLDCWGVSFSRVVGSTVEIHGEWALRRGTAEVALAGVSAPLALDDESRMAVVLGGKYTHSSGVSVIAELSSADGLVPISGSGTTTGITTPQDARLRTERRHEALLSVSKTRLRELPGWKEWDLALALLISLSDGSHIAIADVARRLGGHFTLQGRVSMPAGARGASEYGSIPYATQLSLGIRIQL